MQIQAPGGLTLGSAPNIEIMFVKNSKIRLNLLKVFTEDSSFFFSGHSVYGAVMR